MKKRIIKLSSGLLLLICFSCIILYIVFPIIIKKQAVNTVTKFSDSQISTIADKLNIASDEIAITKMTYLTPRDKIFIINTQLKSINSLDKNYTKQNSSSDSLTYENNSNKNIYCSVSGSSAPFDAVFTVYEFDKSLEDIALIQNNKQNTRWKV